MPQIDDAELFGNAEDQRAYEDFCANQEAVEKFTLDKPALICRWRMSNKKVPMLNRHIRALSERLVQGEPLTHNMLSWAKQHVEWSLAEGDYTAHDGVLMLVIDINGNAAMTVGEYEPLADTSAKALRARSAEARSEADETGVAPELLAAVNNGELAFVAPADECLCGTATLIEQLAQTKGIPVTRVDIPAQLKGALFLVSDEHGVVPATDAGRRRGRRRHGRLLRRRLRKASRPPLNDYSGTGIKESFWFPSPLRVRGGQNAPAREQFCHLGDVRGAHLQFRSHNGGKTTKRGAESMALIYVVEDDEPIRRELIDILARAGFEIEACESFEHVSRDILAAAPDLVLLDLTLPVKDGQHICHEVRRESEVPIIVLTSRTTEIDEVMAMTLGADDFVPKPYSARVLVARINALLRRTAAAGERSTLVHKGLELDLARSMVTNTATGDSTELTKNELRILSLLLSRAGKIVSRSAIMQDLWDSDAFVDDNTLTVNINRLRTTLEKIGIKGYLTTHRGQGYSV